MSRQLVARDPHWTVLRFLSTCRRDGCGAKLPAGARAFYYPASRSCYGDACGHGQEAAADFAAACADEETSNFGVAQ